MLNSIQDLFFPNRCLACPNIIPSNLVLCVHCSYQLAPTNWTFSNAHSLAKKINRHAEIEKAYSLFFFRQKSPIQKVLHQQKYLGRDDLASFWLNSIPKKVLREIKKEIDLLIPVPIHPKRQKERGYNQVIPFAEKLALSIQKPLLKDGLNRKKFGTSQITKNRNQRFQSLTKVFFAKPLALSFPHILLIDDVCTTGATLVHCIQALQKVNPCKISVFTLAYVT